MHLMIRPIMPYDIPKLTENPFVLISGFVLVITAVLIAVVLSRYVAEAYKGNRKKATLFFAGITAFVTLNEATYLADFETWKEKGVFVQKGERAITLLEPGNEFTREDGSTGFSINVKKVFDISQTNSERSYSRRTPDERRVIKALISSSPCDIRMTNELDGNVCARYVPKDDAIYIRQGLDGEDIFRSLSQEIVIANFAKNGVAREDCVFTAYCATYVLCERNGFDTGDFDFEKVPEMFKDAEPKAIRGQLDKIRDSANELSQDMNRIMEEQQKAKRSRDDGAR